MQSNAWTEALPNNNIFRFHEIITQSNFVDLTSFLEISIKANSVQGTFVVLAAICNYNIFLPGLICNYLLNAIQDYGLPLNEIFVFKIIDMFMKYSGPRGIYLVDDFKYARMYKKGVAYNYLKRRANKNWSSVLFAIYCRILLKTWILSRLQPDSSYIKKKALNWLL